MFVQILLGAGLLSLIAALCLTLVGVWALWSQRKLRKALPVQQAHVLEAVNPPQPPSVALEGKGLLPLEQGVLLNTLWEHLPNADCQAGECGGCKVRLLEGQVRWIREPVAQFDRSTHILACSCEPLGPVRCALDEAAT